MAVPTDPQGEEAVVIPARAVGGTSEESEEGA